jgi:hypothetical protein
MIIHFHIQERRSKGGRTHVRFDILPMKFSNDDDWDITGLIDCPYNEDFYLVRTNNPCGKYVRVRSNYYLTTDKDLYENPFKVELDGRWKPFGGVKS